MSRSSDFQHIAEAIHDIRCDSNNPTLNALLYDVEGKFLRLANAANTAEKSNNNVDYVTAVARQITNKT